MVKKRRRKGTRRRALYGSYHSNSGGVLHTVTARLENAANTLYRSHLNYLKDLLPEVGRTFKAALYGGFLSGTVPAG